MGRKTILLLVAAMIAALGSGMVFLYVKGADQRAVAAQAPVQVLTAVTQINPGESLSAAQAAGKLQLKAVPKAQVLTGAVNSVDSMSDQVALAPVYPGEQIVTAKFGAPGDHSMLTLPKGEIAISVTLTDTGRVAGFVLPGDDIAVFLHREGAANGEAATATDQSVRMLVPRAQVVGVGATTVTTMTTTNPEGAQTTEQLPRTLFTLAVTQEEAEKVILAARTGELALALLSDDSEVAEGPGTNTDTLFR